MFTGRNKQIHIHKVQSAKKFLISPSNFTGNLKARKPNKAQTKRGNITYSIFARINKWCQLRLLYFILSLFYFFTIFANFPFFICLCHRQSMPPLWLGRA